MPEFAENIKGGSRFYVRVTPGARKTVIEGWMRQADTTWALKIRVQAAPEDGKANKAVIALLAKACGVPTSSFVIEKGETQRLKRLHCAAEIAAILNGYPEAK